MWTTSVIHQCCDDDDDITTPWQPELYTADLQARLLSASLVASSNVKPRSEQPSRMLSIHFPPGLSLVLDPAVGPCPHNGWVTFFLHKNHAWPKCDSLLLWTMSTMSLPPTPVGYSWLRNNYLKQGPYSHTVDMGEWSYHGVRTEKCRSLAVNNQSINFFPFRRPNSGGKLTHAPFVTRTVYAASVLKRCRVRLFVCLCVCPREIARESSKPCSGGRCASSAT